MPPARPVPTYAVGRLFDVVLGDDIVRYLQGIDATLEPFAGKFLVHGAPPQVLEGEWSGDLIVIGFPSRAAAEAWYRSPAYQALLLLRVRNARSDVILIDGVEELHRATDVLAGRAAGRLEHAVER